MALLTNDPFSPSGLRLPGWEFARFDLSGSGPMLGAHSRTERITVKVPIYYGAREDQIVEALYEAIELARVSKRKHPLRPGRHDRGWRKAA